MLRIIKQKLWTKPVMYLAYYINQQRGAGRMRYKMNKFTVPESLKRDIRAFDMEKELID